MPSTGPFVIRTLDPSIQQGDTAFFVNVKAILEYFGIDRNNFEIATRNIAISKNGQVTLETLHQGPFCKSAGGFL